MLRQRPVLVFGLAVLGVLADLPSHLQAEAPAERSRPRVIIAPRRYMFTIDPQTSLKELLPPPPKASGSFAPLMDDDLSKVPEVMFQDPSAIKMPPDEKNRTQLPIEFLESQVAHQIAKINHLNLKKTDHFMEVLISRRPDLEGLPFMMGKACRLTTDRNPPFHRAVNLVRSALNGSLRKSSEINPNSKSHIWEDLAASQARLKRVEDRDAKTSLDQNEEEIARIAALMQMLGPEGKDMHLGLTRYLGERSRTESTRALARLAVFSSESAVRNAALKILRTRPAKDTDEVLLAGLRYPWPAIAKNASVAMMALKRADLVPQLVKLLDEPDPRLPFVKEENNKKTTIVREMVRINHHRNCLLCHAPGNTPDVVKSEDVVRGAIPLPGQPFSPSFGGYGMLQSPDILVRADVTYLRQDFSVLMPVAEAKPWPDKQRFDFLVRTRVVDEKEASRSREALAKGNSPYREAVHAALRALTGRDAEPTAAAWRKALGPGKS